MFGLSRSNMLELHLMALPADRLFLQELDEMLKRRKVCSAEISSSRVSKPASMLWWPDSALHSSHAGACSQQNVPFDLPDNGSRAAPAKPGSTMLAANGLPAYPSTIYIQSHLGAHLLLCDCQNEAGTKPSPCCCGCQQFWMVSDLVSTC